MHFNEDFNKYLERIKRFQSQFNEISEESTKNALVMPFFALLGYDVFDTNEFMPEFVCDVATKKGEKVDYAILRDGEPVVLIEVKRAGMKLQKQQQGQLYRYFSTNRCRVAILTNGITYQFYSDLNAANIMDDEPFLSFNLLEDDPSIFLSAVRQFRKETFDVKNVISKAVYQKYAKVVEKTLKDDILHPSDEIVKYFLSRPEVKTGNRITSQMIEKYREITQRAMRKVFGITIQDSSASVPQASAIPEPVSDPTSEKASDNETKPDENIITNDEPVQNEETIPEELPVPTFETVYDDILHIAEDALQDFSYKQEDSADFVRLHLYTSGRKIGAVKIIRSDLSITFRRFENGIPTQYILTSAEDIRNYL